MDDDRDIRMLDAEALADVHERACAKLAAARAAPVPHQSATAGGLSAAARYAGWLMAMVAPVALLAVWPPARLDIRDPATWLQGPWLLFTAAMVVFVVHAFITLDWKRRRMDPAERLVRSYFANTGNSVRVPVAAGQVLEADFDATMRRPPGLAGDFTVPPVIADEKLHMQYWKGLSNPGWRTHTGWVVNSVEILNVADDLRLALVSLDVGRKHGGVLGIPGGMGTLFVLWAFIAVTQWLDTEPWYVFWAALIALAVVAHWLGKLFSRKPETYRVRKLVVHSGGKWRMFNGEWEGWEEIDLSWLDNNCTNR